MSQPTWPSMTGVMVQARYAKIANDGTDADILPDWAPAVGTEVVLTPEVTGPLVYDPSGAKIIIVINTVVGIVAEDGYLKTSDGLPIRIAPSDDPLLSKTGWYWNASWTGGSAKFPALTGTEVNLADWVLVDPTNHTMEEWVTRVQAAIDGAGTLISIDEMYVDGQDVVVVLTNGSETRFTIPPGPSGDSAYQIAIQEGFSGSVTQWLDSLRGSDSTTPGPSAYEIAVTNGFVGSEPEWVTSLRGIDGDSAYTAVSTQTGTSYTLQASDIGKLIVLNAAAPIALTVPSGFAPGQRFDVLVAGEGMVTVVGGAGMTVEAAASTVSRAQWSGLSVLIVTTSFAVVVGDLAS